MLADYGYTVAEGSAGRVFTVSKSRAATNTARVILLGCFSLAGGLLASLFGVLPYFVMLVAVFVVIWIVLANLGSSGTTFTLDRDRLVADGQTYNKPDIRNLSIWEPGHVYAYGRNQFEAAANAGIANALNKENFAVVFDYGRNKVWLCKFLTEPQANAVASEVSRWLAA